MDAAVTPFAAAFVEFTTAMTEAARTPTSELSQVGQYVQDFLSTPIRHVELINEDFPAARSSRSTWPWRVADGRGAGRGLTRKSAGW